MTRRGWAKTPEAAAEALAEVYAQLPRITCQGLCADSCTSFGMTVVEQRAIRAQTGKTLPLVHAGSYCPALTILRQCSVYESRPMICRLWGLVPAMRCNYGCVPEGSFLADAQCYEFLAQVAEISGDHAQAAAYREPFQHGEQGIQDASRKLRMMQMERDLAHLEKSKRDNAVFVAGPGRLVKKKPR